MLKRLLIVILVGVMSTGCVTRAVLGDKIYRERISAYLVSQDGKSFVALGEQHHYIFELNETVTSVLSAPYRHQIELRVPQLTVSPDGSAVAAYRLVLDSDAPLETKELAMRAGFTGDVRFRPFATGYLTGKRFAASLLPGDAKVNKFNRRLEVVVNEKRWGGEKVGRAAMSPVAAAADGALILFGVPLFAAHVLINGHE